VTGASTGIGREIALVLASRGVKVAVTARSAARLSELAENSPLIMPVSADVTNPQDMARAHAAIVSSLGAIDLAILNAGVWDPMGGTDFTAARVADSMAVNYMGLAHALEPLLPAMIEARRGQVALVASVAGYRGLPRAAAYAPSKAAAISLAEVLHADLARHGVKVSIVNPGFVETPMTSVNTFPMPFIIKADDAARRIVKGLAKGKFEIAFPWQMVAILKLARALPYPAYFWLVRNHIAPDRATK
jgi:short-subunit dehydrogenase